MSADAASRREPGGLADAAGRAGLDPRASRRLASVSVLAKHRMVSHQFVYGERGRGIGWVDAHLLASALAYRARPWTADERLDALARELLVSYEFTRPT